MSQLMDVLLSGVFAPNPKKYAWVSEVEAGPYHLETDASAANGGNTFVALCGVKGDFNCHFTAAQIIARLKCQECRQLSTANILDVADQGKALQQGIESLRVGSCGEATASPLQSLEDSCGEKVVEPRGALIDHAMLTKVGSGNGSDEPAGPSSIAAPAGSSLPVPLGREVSGSTHTRARLAPCSISEHPVTAPADQERGISDSQIFSYFPLAEIVEKVFKQRSFLCN